MITSDQLWHYRATWTRVVDGDTFVMFTDDGKHGYSLEMYRLEDLDTWEKRGDQKARGMAAMDATAAWLDQETRAWDAHLATLTKRAADPERVRLTYNYTVTWPFFLRTELDDAFGRYLVRVFGRASQTYLTDYLRTNGHEKDLTLLADRRHAAGHGVMV